MEFAHNAGDRLGATTESIFWPLRKLLSHAQQGSADSGCRSCTGFLLTVLCSLVGSCTCSVVCLKVVLVMVPFTCTLPPFLGFGLRYADEQGCCRKVSSHLRVLFKHMIRELFLILGRVRYPVTCDVCLDKMLLRNIWVGGVWNLFLLGITQSEIVPCTL